MMGRLNDFHSLAVSVLRVGRGYIANGQVQQRPERTLELYEFEGCPYCRKAREAFSELDLDYVAHPCGRGSSNRQVVIDLGGKALFPFLVDPNNGRQMYESEDIITYLYENYASGRSGLKKALSFVNTFGSAVAGATRPKGFRALSGADRTQPDELLTLWQFEASPYCRKVREVLCELNLDYVVRNVAKRSTKRPELIALGGKMLVPYLVDPNTDTAMYESDDIIDYLRTTYA